MARFNDDFMFEEIEDQIEQAARSLHEIPPQKQIEPKMRLLQELHSIYREEPQDAHSLERVWDRFVQVTAPGEQQPASLLKKERPAVERGKQSRQFIRPPLSARKKGVFSHLNMIAAVLLLVSLVGSMGVIANLAQQNRNALLSHPTPTVKVMPGTRDPKQWPFAQNSIWNMPVGTRAVYTPAQLHAATTITYDEDYFIVTSASDPEQDVYTPGPWDGGRCTGTTHIEKIHFPHDLVVPDASKDFTPINAAAVLQPDGRSLVQISPLTRCEAGGNVYGWVACGWGHTEDIKGDGLCGAHFSSGLSSIGGMVRSGELTGDQPIRHALQLAIWMAAYGYYSQAIPGYRWPATTADNGASQRYCTLDPCKSYPNSGLAQGSLLAIPPTLTPEKLGIKTEAGKKMFYALQNYGGYLVTDTGRDAFQLGVEKGVPDQFARAYGYPFGEGAFHDDVNRLFPTLQIINNNSPTSIGGGGVPRVPLAPPFAPDTHS